jgi:hypothetical protein
MWGNDVQVDSNSEQLVIRILTVCSKVIGNVD